MRIFGISKRKMTYATIILKYPHVSLLTVKFFVVQFVTDLKKKMALCLVNPTDTTVTSVKSLTEVFGLGGSIVTFIAVVPRF